MRSTLPVTRRQFLRHTTTALGAAIAAPVIAPASALGRGGALPPSYRITMGFIGVGGQGSGHLLGGAWTYVAGGYAGRKDVQVLAVCDVWRDRRERACQKVNDHYAEAYGNGNYKSCEAYTDFRHVLDRADIDAVLIATPAHWHATMAAMAAEAGKDLYCEKPTAVTVRESQAMLAAVRRYGRVYQAGTQQRSEYGGKFRRACEFVRSGRIGKLQAIYAYRDGGAVFWPQRFGPASPSPPGWTGISTWDPLPGCPMMATPAPTASTSASSTGASTTTTSSNGGRARTTPGRWSFSWRRTAPVTSMPAAWWSMANLIPASRWATYGGACFVGTEGRIAVDREALVSDPPDIVREPLRPDEVHLYRSTTPRGQLPGVHPHPQKTNLRREHRSPGRQRAAAGRHRQAVEARRSNGTPRPSSSSSDDEANRMLSIAKRPPWCI